MNYTQNYQLNQWEASDRVLRTDFNADNAKIDAAIAAAALGNCRVEYGTYVGTGTCTSKNPTPLRLGYQPKLVIIGYGSLHAMFIWGCSAGHSPNYDLPVRWLEDGLEWWTINDNTATPSGQLNQLDTTYHFIAFS